MRTYNLQLQNYYDDMNRLQEIVRDTRQTGSTTWILKSAIKNPECIIVCRNMQQAKGLERKYNKMLSDVWLGKKLWWKLFGRKQPKFLSIRSNFRGFGLPVIFDNASIV